MSAGTHLLPSMSAALSTSTLNRDGLITRVSIGHSSEGIQSCNGRPTTCYDSNNSCSLRESRKYESLSLVATRPPKRSSVSPAPVVVIRDATPSPVVHQVEHVPYEDISESFRQDIDRMIAYDSLVGSMVAETVPPQQNTDSILKTTEPGIENIEMETSPQPSFESTPATMAATIHKVDEKDIERLREYVRMDKGLPLKRAEDLKRRKPTEFRKEPTIRPKMNRATAVRAQFIRKCSMMSAKKTETVDVDASIRSREEEMISRLKKLVFRYKSTDQPLYKYNRGFEMRYQSNKGNPLMPSSFRDSYEAYNKPLFMVPKKLILPKIHLWPEYEKRQISYLGLRIGGDTAPLQYQLKEIFEGKKTRKQARPPIRKTKRVPRLKILPRSGKKPWNYGVFERALRKH